MKKIISIVFIFFIIVNSNFLKAAELLVASDNEVKIFLNQKLKNNWYGLYVTDDPKKKIGYIHEENKFEKDKKLFSNNLKYYTENSHDGNLDFLELTINTFFESELPYNFVKQVSKIKTKEEYHTEEIIIKNDIIEIFIDSNGETSEERENNFDFRLNHFFGIETWLNNKSPQLNETKLLRSISEGTPDDILHTITDINETNLNGGLKTFFNIDSELVKKTDENNGLSINTFWNTSEPLTMQFPLGVWTTGKLESEVRAKDINYIADSIVLSSIKIDETSHSREQIYEEVYSQIDKEKKVIGMIYEITGDYDNSFIENNKYQNIQTFKSENLKLLYLGEHGFSTKEKVSEEDFIKAQQYKNENKILNSLAAEITKNAKNEKDIITMLMDWSYKNIKYVSELKEVTDPYEILKNKKGDCTEITDLFNALLMSLGIPAKPITGYGGGIFYGGDDSFGGHKWSKVAHEGEWIPIDATWNEFIENSINHIETKQVDEEEYLYKKKYKLKLWSVQYDGAFKSFFHENGKIGSG